MSLTKQLIHDEANTSVGDVHKQLDISKKEYGNKLKRLTRLIHMKSFEHSKFKSCSLVSELTNRFECRLFTKDKAALNLILTRYNNDRFFFGTRGSPMRVLTGQNVIEHTEHERVLTLKAKLGCSLFEARTIVGFELVQECSTQVLGEPMFTPNELAAIYDRRIGVYSIGFARYVNFGLERDDNFHMLTYLATQEINMKGVKFPIMLMLGNLKATTWEGEAKSNSIGLNTSLLLQKKTNGSSLSFQQMLYIKEAEILAKDSKANEASLKSLSVKQQTEMEGTVRIDNTFFKPYLKEWLKQLSPDFGKTDDLLLRDVAPLFENSNMIRDMCDIMSHELGVKLFLLAPTPKRIEELAHGEEEEIGSDGKRLMPKQRLVIQDWIKNCRLRLKKSKSTGHVTPDWDGSIASKNSRLARRLYGVYCLDIRVPYDFYVHLDRMRGEFHYSEMEARAAADAARNFGGRYSLAHKAPDIQEKIGVLIDDSLTLLRRSLQLTNEMPKDTLLDKYDLLETSSQAEQPED